MSQLKPFKINIPDEALADLRTRLQRTRWIDDVFQGDWCYGAPLPFVRMLCDYWLNVFDWRALEARLNREQHVTTEIEGLTIHAMTRRSDRADAIPLLVLHGWPSSFVEFLELYDPLCAPPAGAPAFHVVTPSLPGYGFSTTKPRMGTQNVAPVMVELMRRMGYERFMVQGGDWGSAVGTEIGRQFPDRVIGLHLNLVYGSVPPDKDSLQISAEEQAWVAGFGGWLKFTHFVLQANTPASMAHGLNDSPAGLAAWIGEKFHDWVDGTGIPEPLVSLDHYIRNIALYWFTGTAGSSARLYWEMLNNPPEERKVMAPTAGAIFPTEVAKLPRAWAERHYNIVQWTVHKHGGHFAALEHPDWLVDDVRRFAKLVASPK